MYSKRHSGKPLLTKTQSRYMGAVGSIRFSVHLWRRYRKGVSLLGSGVATPCFLWMKCEHRNG